MKNSKFIQVLESFERKEITLLIQFIESPFFNKNETLIIFFKIILEEAPAFDEQKVNKKVIFKKMFPREKFDDLKLRHIMSDAYKLVEKFLVHHKVEEENEEGQLKLLEVLAHKNLEKNFESTYKKLYKILENKPIRDAKYFDLQFHMESINNYFLLEKGGRANELNLQQVANKLDVFFLVKKLRICCDILNYQNLRAVKHELFLLDEILTHLRNKKYENIPSISIYYQILMTLIDIEHEQHFLKLKSLLKEHSKEFPKEEARDMYHFALNYCIKKLNQGKEKYVGESFMLYKEALEKEVLYENNYLSPWNFKNIVAIALRLGHFQWVYDFIEKYISKIKLEYRQNAYIYNMAKLHFYQKEYHEVVKLLQKVEYEDVFYGLDSKSTLIKTYFETDQIGPLLSSLESFSVFLNRNKVISEYKKRSYLNMIKYIKKLTNLEIMTQEDKEKLRKRIKEEKYIADSKWILEKLNIPSTIDAK